MNVKMLFHDLIALCLGCKEKLAIKTQILCIDCSYQLACSRQLTQKKMLKALWGRLPFEAAHSLYAFQKGSVIQELLHALKYKKQRKVGVFLGQQLAATLRLCMPVKEVDGILAVPLHKKKETIRGYNQSVIIAEAVGKALGIVVIKDVLIRQEETATQTKKSRYERAHNTMNAFKLIEGHSLANKHLLLIDDVLTTGATVEGVWQALKEVDRLQLSLATIAYTP